MTAGPDPAATFESALAALGDEDANTETYVERIAAAEGDDPASIDEMLGQVARMCAAAEYAREAAANGVARPDDEPETEMEAMVASYRNAGVDALGRQAEAAASAVETVALLYVAGGDPDPTERDARAAAVAGLGADVELAGRSQALLPGERADELGEQVDGLLDDLPAVGVPVSRAYADFAERGYDETRAAVAAASEEEGEGRGADR